MSEFTKLGGYLIEGQPEVAHDNSMSGNGTVDSPLGVVNPLPYPMEIVSTSSEATGTNILYVVTGAGA